MTSFATFVASEYKSLHPGMRKHYGSLENFLKLYAANNGFTPWLETLRGKSISLGLTNSIAKMYIEKCRRFPDEIPGILASISRTYDVELPMVEGILSGQYWERKAQDLNWKLPKAS